MNNKLLIFDLDGTLTDTVASLAEAVNLALDEFGLPLQSNDQIRTNVGSGIRKLLLRSVPEKVAADEKLFADIFDGFNRHYFVTHCNVDGCYEGVYDTVCKLYRMGYTLAVLSNKTDVYVKNIIRKLFPANIFKMAVGQTELPIKPDPTVPLMMCGSLGFSPADTCFIGDSDVDVATAKNAGFRSVAVSWGFRERSLLEEKKPDAIADTAEELFNILTNE